MKLMMTIVAAAALTLGATVNAKEKEKEETVNLKDLPEAVQKAITTHAAGGEVVRVEKEMEKGKTVYEAVIKKNGKETGHEFDADGKMVGAPHDEATEHAREK